MNKIFKLSIAFSFIFCLSRIYAQDYTNKIIRDLSTDIKSKKTSFTTNSISDIFQAAFDNGIISSSDKTFKVKSTLFKINELWNGDINIDNNYVKTRFNRNFEFGINASLGNNNQIKGFGTSFKYAFVNNRDVTVLSRDKFKKEIEKINANTKLLVYFLSDSITSKAVMALNDSKVTESGKSKIKAALHEYNSSQSDEKLNAIIEVLKTEGLVIDNSILTTYSTQRKKIDDEHNKIIDDVKKGSLLSLSFGSNYLDKAWDSVSVRLEYVKGLGFTNDADKPWDFYAGLFYDCKNNSLTNASLQRQVVTGKLGINTVLLKNSASNSSFLELLGALEYKNITKGKLEAEDQSALLADFTLTMRISKTLFVPFEIKYDPKNANVFGFLNIKWDFIPSITPAKK